MILTATELAQARTRHEFDVAIVGTGPAGLAAAYRLMTSGLRVAVLEAGSGRFQPARQAEAFRAAEITPEFHPPTELYRRRVLGGAGTIWGGRCIPFDRSDFDTTSAGDGASWPIGYEDVAPYVAPALAWLDAGAAEFKASEALPGRASKLIEDVADARVSLDEVERFSPPLDMWARYRREFRAAKHLTVVCEAVCTEIILPPGASAASSLRVRARDGTELEIVAGAFVLAAGGLETPRLLLSSRTGRSKSLGDAHDLVGRFYMTHLLADLGRLEIKQKGRSWLDYERSRDGIYVRRLLKLSDEVRRSERLLSAIARANIPPIDDWRHGSGILSAAFLAKRFILPEYRRRLVAEPGATVVLWPHIRNVARHVPGLVVFGWSWTWRRILAARKLPSLFLHEHSVFPLEVIAEQAPNRQSRIALSDQRDAFGLPRLKVEWKPSADDFASLGESLKIMQSALAGSTVARLDLAPAELAGLAGACRPQGGHHIGTARMGATPRDGVVDGWGALWEARNVFLAGSAVFPRSAAANPTLMIVSLAFRTADRIARLAASAQPVPARQNPGA